jgi:hypothetical protein
MRRTASLSSFVVLTAFLQASGRPAWAFTSIQTVTATASVTVGTSASTNLTIQATTLPTQAFFGSNAVIPVQVSSPGVISPAGLSVDVVFQLFDANGNILGAPSSYPISFSSDPANQNALVGSAIIPETALVSIQNGGQLGYLFVARQQSGSGTMRNGTGQAPAPANILGVPNINVFTPFATTITNQFCSAVGPAGARVSAPDLSVTDGQTAVALAPGAVPAPGTLCINSENTTPWPAGPGGSKAAAIYTVTLQNTSLVSPAQVVLSYPSDTNGKVLGSEADPGSLGIYWLDQTNGAYPSGDWRPLSQASLDTTLHTLTGITGHFSTFALFTAGAIGAADLRPAERIITPNGDGINDRAIFGSGIDEVKIFDVRGRRVRTIPGPSPVWDGTDDNGRIVQNGVYIYQFTSQGNRISGVIAVAK